MYRVSVCVYMYKWYVHTLQIRASKRSELRCWEPLKTQATHILIRFLVFAKAWSWIRLNQEQNSQWLPKHSIKPALQLQLEYLSKLCWSRKKKEWQAICLGANFQVNSTVTGKRAVPVQERENADFGPVCKCVGSISGCQPSQWLQQRSSDT